MIIFDGFGSHIDLPVLEFCLQHKILPFCLPAHTSHILQPLDVGVFSPMSTYYAQEVNKLRVPVDKDLFPNLLARAHTKAFTLENIQAGFRAPGIHPYNPSVILNTLSLSEPSLPPSFHPPPRPSVLQTPQDLIQYKPKTPITPRSIHNLYVDGVSAITSNSPLSIKLRAVLTKMKLSAEKNAAQVTMYEEGEGHLREQIRQITDKGKVDRRQLNSDSACVLEHGEVLADLKR